MGFDPISLGAAAVAGTQAVGSVVNAYSQNKAAKQTKQTAESNLGLYENKAKIMGEEALENESRMRRNANREMGRVRADVGQSNLMADGSVVVREIDAATRLESEILDQKRKSLQEIEDLKSQARTEAQEAQSNIRSYRTGSVSSLLSGFGDAARTLVKW